jgi:hypothetical protein
MFDRFELEKPARVILIGLAPIVDEDVSATGGEHLHHERGARPG